MTALSQAASDGIAPLLRWLDRLPEPVDLMLVCAEHQSEVAGHHPGAAVVRLDACLADLPASALLELVLRGTRVEARLEGCERPDLAARSVDDANRLLTSCARPERVALSSSRAGAGAEDPVLDVRALPLPRRALLSMSAGPSGAAAARPPRAATERERMLDALRSLTAPPPRVRPAPGSGSEPPARPRQPRQRDTLDQHPAPSAMLAASGCTGCGVCVQSCPADALRLEGSPADDGRVRVTLRHLPASCLDCGECVARCPHGALESTGRHTWAGLLACLPQFLASEVLRECARCAEPLPSDSTGSLCEICAFRRANPFGARLPPGVAPGVAPALAGGAPADGEALGGG
ncbi:DUF362 domain-containing protein [Cellulomonas chengniuliangii]|uniref:4Fe-4S dicluster domain-containing protein n=1 Tax=Cellulomonas chengniuliangii TaxID=2968084 RepID=A0ABY5L1M2_9CELL|nr:4Fe-4S dicluster domain-containing protein [Cellulomonas chengniuliangii]MCC2307911.1 4Fe-4S dicluster domain-containing protein [Cellulomonas chengniuliangii]UUI75340.1 4Fe-4S dicluster domain-containing protein [Cellulomonas chengniuliangii]